MKDALKKIDDVSDVIKKQDDSLKSLKKAKDDNKPLLESAKKYDNLASFFVVLAILLAAVGGIIAGGPSLFAIISLFLSFGGAFAWFLQMKAGPKTPKENCETKKGYTGSIALMVVGSGFAITGVAALLVAGIATGLPIFLTGLVFLAWCAKCAVSAYQSKKEALVQLKTDEMVQVVGLIPAKQQDLVAIKEDLNQSNMKVDNANAQLVKIQQESSALKAEIDKLKQELLSSKQQTSLFQNQIAKQDSQIQKLMHSNRSVARTSNVPSSVKA